MFGFIRPVKDELRVREVHRFQEVYCGLCHAIRARYGRFHTFFLSYDMTFFALVLGCTETDGAREKRRCDASPIRPRAACFGCAAIDRAADVSVLCGMNPGRAAWRLESCSAWRGRGIGGLPGGCPRLTVKLPDALTNWLRWRLPGVIPLTGRPTRLPGCWPQLFRRLVMHVSVFCASFFTIPGGGSI